MEIKQYKINDVDATLSQNKHAKNWPIVYILNGEKEAYIGELANFERRLKEHLRNEKRASLTEISLIDDDKFNKSAILDIESELIRLMDADEKYELQNIVLGQNQAHDYYQRSEYKKMIKDIWNEIHKIGLAKHDYRSIQNSDLFIYSPYKTLTSDQYESVKDILYSLGVSLTSKPKSSMAVHGNAGTGKSILAIYLMKVLVDIKAKDIEKQELDELEDEGKYENDLIEPLLTACNIKDFKIGMVVPITSFRSTLKKVFKKVKGLKSNMLLTPSDVVNAYLKGEKYDILLIDEAQRLKIAKNNQNIGGFYAKNEALGIDKYSTELDWLLKCSDHQIFFYDAKQSVSGSDITIEDLNAIPYENIYNLNIQMRVEGGDLYMDYIRQIFSNHPPKERINLKDYDVKIFDDVQNMYDEIISKDEVYGLCRNIAGFAWPWNTKKGKADYDIEIQGNKFVWNKSNNAWITNPESVNEIGSIHTLQGQDLNYAGLIIGNDLSYDFDKKEIIINKQEFYDTNAKKGLTDEEIKDNILNAYYILLSRARRGVYLYICDDNFKKYLKQFF